MNISIIIPNYNGRELLNKNIPQVVATTKDYQAGKVEIIIVDDGSSDDSYAVMEKLKHHYTNIVLLKNEKNYGFSTTVNRGVAKATGEIIILLNTDVVPESGYLPKVVKHFSQEKMFGVGFMDKSIEGPNTVLRGRGILYLHRGFVLHKWGETNQNNTGWVSGGSGAFRKAIWDTLGGLNELYNPFYWEDIDISYRAMKKGYILSFDNSILATHEHEKGAIKTQNTEMTINLYSYRNQFLFFWLNISGGNLWINHVIWLPIHVLNALRDKNSTFFKAFFQAVMNIPMILVFRFHQKKQDTVSDTIILQQFRS